MDIICNEWCNIATKHTSFLSENVQELVLRNDIDKSPMDRLYSITDVLDCFSDDVLTPLLLDDEEFRIPPTNRSSDWYSKHITRVAPIFNHLHTKMKAINEEELHNFLHLCSWMHQPHTIELCFNLLLEPENESLNSLECLLLVTSAIERALGNLFLIDAKTRNKVPSLLRDLLATQELISLLGESQTVLLQLLLGSPLSLNLRNLAWHGFLGILDITQHRYASVLLLLCPAIGRRIYQCRSITANEILPRRWATFKQLPEWSRFFNEDLLTDAVSRTVGLPASRKVIWHHAINHYRRGCYGRCSVLILPEIEHTLRLIYCAANDCPRRVLTAESVVHYTTLDIILENTKSNRITEFLGRGLYSALVDVFVEEEGPRIRDRMSHGECQLEMITADVPRHLLAIGTALLQLADKEQVNCLPNYIPHYSLAVVFRRELILTLQVVEEWFLSIDAITNDVDDLLQGVSLVWLQNWSVAVNKQLIDLLNEQQQHRCEVDNSLTATWRRMMSQLVVGCQRMTAYRSLSSSRSSRRRSTHARLDSYMGLFVRAVRHCLFFPIEAALGKEINVTDEKIIRRLKRNVTRWADNFANATVDSRWIELAACARELLQCVEVFHR